VILKFTSDGRTIEIRQVKYLNNILEQDHRFIKRITRPMMGFKAFHSAEATIAGIEAAHMIRKGQIPANGAWPSRLLPGSRHNCAHRASRSNYLKVCDRTSGSVANRHHATGQVNRKAFC